MTSATNSVNLGRVRTSSTFVGVRTGDSVGVQGIDTAESFVPSAPNPPAAAPVRTPMGVLLPSQPATVQSFDSMDPGTQDQIRSKARELASRGQLFVQPAPNAPLQKADAWAIYQSLEQGVGGLVYVVQRGATHEWGSESSARAAGESRSRWSGSNDGYFVSDASSQRERSAEFSSTPLFSWNVLKGNWMEPGQGLPEVTTLPAPSGTIGTESFFHRSHRAESQSNEYHVFGRDRSTASRESAESWRH